MKKLLLPVLVAILFIACNKNDSIENVSLSANKLYPVKFTTQLNFNAMDNPMQKLLRNDSTSLPGDSIYIPTPEDSTHYPKDSIFYRYCVYNAPSGTFVKEKSGTGSAIEDELPQGSYYIAIIGSTNGDLLDKKYAKYSSSYYFSDTISYPTPFYNTFEYTVSGDSMEYLYNGGNVISLERMWGELNVEILDRATCYLPSNVYSVTLRVVGKSNSFEIDTKNPIYNSGITSSTTKNVVSFRQEPSINCLTSFSTDNNQVKVYLNINFIEAIAPKTVYLASTQVKKGVRTTLRGNLGSVFENQGNGNEVRMQVQLSEEWLSDVVDF